MAYSARDLHRAATIYRSTPLLRLRHNPTLCGILISAGLSASLMISAITWSMRSSRPERTSSTRTSFEALGFRHYIAGDEYKYGAGDAELRELMIDRIYDTFID